MADTGAAARGQFLGHPIGLFVLFFTEMWERFSYYGMRALLLLYMTDYFLWNQQTAGGIYKWYTSLVYLTPLLGGFLADRYLGNKWAIIIGGSLMAIGHFAMAFEEPAIFYAALVFLIVGNGFFKPNMSTQVGRLYAVGDPRRDAAYTIFYMGINLGAFLAPLVCGALRETPGFGFHWGFAAAGVGMVIGLATYLLGLRWVNEIPETAVYHDTGAGAAQQDAAESQALTEPEAEQQPSVAPALSAGAPALLLLTGLACVAAAAILGALKLIPIDNAVALGAGVGVSALMSYYIVRNCQNAVRDRVLAILIVGVFVIFFWGAFEQAGSAMNVWADKTTNRYVTQTPPVPEEFPVIEEEHASELSLGAQLGGAFLRIFQFNPMSTASFQSINPLAIFLLAPLFAFLWTWLPRRGINLSIPAKIAIGVFLNGLAFALMIWAVQVESQPTQAPLSALPSGLYTDADSRLVFRDVPDLGNDAGFENFDRSTTEHRDVLNGGRIRFDQSERRISNVGVLSDLDRDRLLRASVSKEFLLAIRKLALDSEAASAAAGKSEFSASVELAQVPAGFELRYAGFSTSKVSFDPATRTIRTTTKLADREYKLLLLAGADPALRVALQQVVRDSAKFKVGVWWLVVFYLLCTLGELCLSPVGLSMVSKLAPARFATMLMGMWLLTSFFGNYLAGLAGESWGTVDPTMYFVVISGLLGAAALLCFVLSRWIFAMMHGVR